MPKTTFPLFVAALCLGAPMPFAISGTPEDPSPAAAATAEAPADISLATIQGKTVKPLVPPADGKAAVVIFTTTDCPIANGYVPEINRIFSEYSPKGVSLTLVQVDPDLATDEAVKHAEEYRIEPPVVIDRKHRLVAATGAEVTPETAVFDAKGQLVYLGRIDDQYAGYGDRRNQARVHDLRNALDAILAGKPVEHARVESLGCYIPELN